MQTLTNDTSRNSDIDAQHSAAQAVALSPLTRALLIGGMLASPLYVVVGAAQMLLRPGFDPTRHDLSLMSNGSLGWIQTRTRPARLPPRTARG